MDMRHVKSGLFALAVGALLWLVLSLFGSDAAWTGVGK